MLSARLTQRALEVGAPRSHAHVQEHSADALLRQESGARPGVAAGLQASVGDAFFQVGGGVVDHALEHLVPRNVAARMVKL